MKAVPSKTYVNQRGGSGGNACLVAMTATIPPVSLNLFC